jgi:hypothetical protein
MGVIRQFNLEEGVLRVSFEVLGWFIIGHQLSDRTYRAVLVGLITVYNSVACKCRYRDLSLPVACATNEHFLVTAVPIICGTFSSFGQNWKWFVQTVSIVLKIDLPHKGLSKEKKLCPIMLKT